MNILNITQTQFGKAIEIQEFPHAQPVVPDNLQTEQEILDYLNQPNWNGQSWELTQTEIDSINNGTATQEIIDKHKPKPKFDADLAMQRLDEEMPADRIVALATLSHIIERYMRAEKWEKLSQILQQAMVSGLAIQSDYDIFSNILAEQNVTLP